MKIRLQAIILAVLGLLITLSVAFIILTQLNNTERVSHEMQAHQQALIQLNSYQVAAINQILLSVDLVRTGDITGDPIVSYRMSETGFSREVEYLKKLFDLEEELKPQLIQLQLSGKSLSNLCKYDLMEPLYSHKAVDEGIIENLIYDELPQLSRQVNFIENELNNIISRDLKNQRIQEKRFRQRYLPLVTLFLLLQSSCNIFLISRTLRYINRTRAFLGDLAEGKGRLDLTMSEKGRDEITELRKNFNRFMKNLNERQLSLKEISTEQVHSGKQLNAIAQENSSAYTQIGVSLTNVNDQTQSMSGQVEASYEEMNHISRALNKLSQLSGDLDERINFMSRQGETLQLSLASQNRAVDQQVQLTYKVKEESLNSLKTVEVLKDQIKEILRHSSDIFKAMVSIQDLADRTDVLAINASIEAAHSGKYGKGFTVVAHEMRNLSGQVRSNTENVSRLLKDLNKSLGLMSKEEKENQESITRLIDQNDRAENSVIELKDSNKRMEDIINNFFTELQTVRTASGEVNNETDQVRSSSDEITLLMDKLKNSYKTLSRESEEITQGLEQFARGSELLEKLSESNSSTAFHLEREIGKLGL
ncbi:MAG: methyl-accepting chemotaxis protein [Spirochaetales bacterium]|nr:methyl-accepting chemotaxis protein [Spirochaetales bacterium]